jgi:AmmeMemoRadiSam system protein A
VSLNEEEQGVLLRVARQAIANAIRAAGVEAADVNHTALSDRHGEGAFVSIHVQKELRGCIGYPQSDLPLLEVVRHCAASAATADPRFPAVTASEWRELAVEISVLGSIEPVGDLSEIEIGRHGLIAARGQSRGLLLPQVATEWGWSREEFAAHTCRKAGLPADAWKTDARLFKFEAQVFGDL